MGDFEPPSFSLGFDVLADQRPEETATHRDGEPGPSFDLLGEDEGREKEDPSPRVLKRLRRGPSSTPRPRSAPDDPVSEILSDVDDEIEEFSEFSSPEDRIKGENVVVWGSQC